MIDGSGRYNQTYWDYGCSCGETDLGCLSPGCFILVGPGVEGGCFRQRDFLVWAVALGYNTRGRITWRILNEVSWAGWSDRRCGILVKYPRACFYFFPRPPGLFVVDRDVEDGKTPPLPPGSLQPPLSPPPPPATKYVIKPGSIYHTSPGL